MATDTTPRISINDLTPEHLNAFKLTLSEILATDLAELPFAQIIDDLPIRDAYYGYGYGSRADIDNHINPCPDSTDMFRAFRITFNFNILRFDANVVQAYQDAPSNSKYFNLRLLEMVAIACHDIAVLLFNNAKDSRHLQEHDKFLPPFCRRQTLTIFHLLHPNQPISIIQAMLPGLNILKALQMKWDTGLRINYPVGLFCLNAGNVG
ncbi:MAG: hypothetical protein M1834_002429 [Cirrosporium novae-zelandiae]|nr:MAG: hypothetical protein M1834_002429 [Cirrosporium novae-zelandiae]